MSNFFNSLVEKLYLSQEGNKVYWDTMTNTNTRYYYDNVIKTKYNDKEVFLAFIDINNLKLINDRDGHHAGSDVIRKTAHDLSLLNLLEVCRIGGDEFIIIADKSFVPSNLNIIENISYGYVIKKADQTVGSAVKIADEYMYKRKKKIHKKDGAKTKKDELARDKANLQYHIKRRRHKNKKERKTNEESNNKHVQSS